MSHSLKVHIRALWILTGVLALLAVSYSVEKSQGKRHTFGDARVEHILVRNHCTTYSASQVDYLIQTYGDYGHDGKPIYTHFAKWLKTLAGDPCEMLAFEIKREINN